MTTDESKTIKIYCPYFWGAPETWCKSIYGGSDERRFCWRFWFPWESVVVEGKRPKLMFASLLTLRTFVNVSKLTGRSLQVNMKYLIYRYIYIYVCHVDTDIYIQVDIIHIIYIYISFTQNSVSVSKFQLGLVFILQKVSCCRNSYIDPYAWDWLIGRLRKWGHPWFEYEPSRVPLNCCVVSGYNFMSYSMFFVWHEGRSSLKWFCKMRVKVIHLGHPLSLESFLVVSKYAHSSWPISPWCEEKNQWHVEVWYHHKGWNIQGQAVCQFQDWLHNNISKSFTLSWFILCSPRQFWMIFIYNICL